MAADSFCVLFCVFFQNFYAIFTKKLYINTSTSKIIAADLYLSTSKLLE